MSYKLETRLTLTVYAIGHEDMSVDFFSDDRERDKAFEHQQTNGHPGRKAEVTWDMDLYELFCCGMAKQRKDAECEFKQ